MNNAEEVGCLGVECAEAREASSQAERGTVSEHRCIVCSGCLCCLVSLKSRPNPGLLVLDILPGTEVSLRCGLLLFSFLKRIPGANKIAHKHKTRTSPFCPLPVQSGRECDSCSAPPRICPSCAQAGRDVILKQEFCCAAAHRLDSMIAHTPPSLRRAPPCVQCPLPLMKCNL